MFTRDLSSDFQNTKWHFKNSIPPSDNHLEVIFLTFYHLSSTSSPGKGVGFTYKVLLHFL
jgi:hypothetical protein